MEDVSGNMGGNGEENRLWEKDGDENNKDL